MILAGVDEAGLGPRLGPLVTASAALRVPDDWRPDSPWQRLESAVAKSRRRGDPRPVVADSKEVYRSGGLAALELATGVFSLLANDRCRPDLLAADADIGPGPHPCYSQGLNPFPGCVGLEPIRSAAAAVGSALARSDAGAAHLEAAALYEPALNRRFDQGVNKNAALLGETGRHLRRLEGKFPTGRLLVVVDKQGGRNDYLPFLSGLFPGRWLDALVVGADVSAYRLRREGGDIEFRFQAKADRLSFPTALASLAAKYVRERAMAELNAWFGARCQGLRPTAGYPLDARRWLDEAARRGGKGLGVGLLVRAR